MVPLHVVDGVLREHRVDPVEEVVDDLGTRQVEDLLVAVQQRRPRLAGRQDPLRVRAEEVGVRVDHLRLEPEPELHAQPSHVLDERVQPVGPHLLVDHPVAEAGGVVAAVVEPAVVEHEPLHAHARARGRRSAATGRGRGRRRPPPRRSARPAGAAGWASSDRWYSCQTAASPSRPSSDAATYTQGETYDDPVGSTTSPGSRSSPPPMVAPCAAVRSTRSTELPLQPTCTPTTLPRVVENPAVPATTMVAASSPGRPPRPSRNQSPSSTVCRCGVRSRSWRPVKSSRSTWSSARGSTTSRPSTTYSPSPTLVTVARPRRPPPTTASSS